MIKDRIAHGFAVGLAAALALTGPVPAADRTPLPTPPSSGPQSSTGPGLQDASASMGSFTAAQDAARSRAAAPGDGGRSSVAAAGSAPGEMREAAATTPLLVNGDFETGDLTGWSYDEADVAAVSTNPPPVCFDPPPNPTTNHYMACMSTGTWFGGASAGGMRSDLSSDTVVLTFRPYTIKVSFTVDFQTSEQPRSLAHNDAFEARLVTPVGTYPIILLDTVGRTISGHGLTVANYFGLEATASDCPLNGLRTRRITVTWTRSFSSALQTAIGKGPFWIEFSVSNQGDTQHPSIVCIDDVTLKASR
jgi:hypothetical protein